MDKFCPRWCKSTLALANHTPTNHELDVVEADSVTVSSKYHFPSLLGGVWRRGLIQPTQTHRLLALTWPNSDHLGRAISRCSWPICHGAVCYDSLSIMIPLLTRGKELSKMIKIRTGTTKFDPTITSTSEAKTDSVAFQWTSFVQDDANLRWH